MGKKRLGGRPSGEKKRDKSATEIAGLFSFPPPFSFFSFSRSFLFLSSSFSFFAESEEKKNNSALEKLCDFRDVRSVTELRGKSLRFSITRQQISANRRPPSANPETPSRFIHHGMCGAASLTSATIWSGFCSRKVGRKFVRDSFPMSSLSAKKSP